MAPLLRLLPRHWDGRRLLRFVTGLALLALMFGGPAAGPASAVSTTTGTTTSSTRATSAESTATAGTAVETGATGAAAVQHQTECQHDGSGVARSVPVADRAAPAGVAPGTHGSRAPPHA